MYREFFNLTELPFLIAPDPRYLYMGERHREALAHLLYGVAGEGGFVLLTGEVGTGKTTICRCLLEQIPDNTDIAFIINPKLTSVELLASICDELAIKSMTDRTSIKGLTDAINHHLLANHAEGRNTTLIIDEAQNLSHDVLEQLRLLTNLETNRKKLLQIMLLGQPELNTMLATTELRQFSQRIIARYHLMPLNADEMVSYISHRLSVAGCREVLFSDRAIASIYHLTQGIPRLINTLCDRSLLGAYAEEISQVDRKTVLQAANELFGNDQKKRKIPWPTITLAMIALLLAAVWYHDATQPLHVERSSAAPDITEPVWLSDNQQAAWQALFSQWHIDYRPSAEKDPCQFAQQHQLRCLKQRGSIAMLRHTNRPTLLHLTGQDGKPRFTTVTALTEEHGTVQLRNHTYPVSIADLQQSWFGDYTLLWRPPPHWSGAVKPGASGIAVSWLYEQLILVSSGTQSHEVKDEYDGSMIDMVRVFQRQHGLKDDGIAGALTLIHLNAATGKPFASLSRSKAAGL